MAISSLCPDGWEDWLGDFPGYYPEEKEYHDLLYLIAYDIKKPRRWRRVAGACLDYGIRVEFSVFECDLPQDTFELLWTRLLHEIDPEEDRLLAYRICGSCVSQIRSIGVMQRVERPLLYIL